MLGEDKNTREQLLESAKAEFAEKGYTKASLRKICAGAGVTTGALYFFFKDKEDLFTAIVGQPFDELKKIMIQHFADERDILRSPDMSEMKKHIDGGHDEIVDVLIHHLYSNYDAFMLLLTKSQGSKYEGCVDEMVEMTDSIYSEMAENIAKHMPGSRVNKYIRHWLTHMIIDAFIHLFTHERDEQKALANMRKILDFLVKGWVDMILISDDEK
ncbi:MAG: TetR/AcrR family transcriptional regulator [Oscillospiraceae bacterium]|nr:TetR/AcrR family transcriptional regulator [Oscillospiraceae bacterium]